MSKLLKLSQAKRLRTTIVENCCWHMNISFFAVWLKEHFCFLCLKSMCIFLEPCICYLPWICRACLANALTSILERFLNPNNCGDIIPTWHPGSPPWTCTITMWQCVGSNTVHQSAPFDRNVWYTFAQCNMEQNHSSLIKSILELVGKWSTEPNPHSCTFQGRTVYSWVKNGAQPS